MLFMLIVKASHHSENIHQPQLPDDALREAMTAYNKELIDAGVRVLAKGLHASENGMRLSFKVPGQPPEVTYGPFEDPSSLVAGFILIDVETREEAIRWAMKMPDPMGRGEGQIELRQLHE